MSNVSKTIERQRPHDIEGARLQPCLDSATTDLALAAEVRLATPPCRDLTRRKIIPQKQPKIRVSSPHPTSNRSNPSSPLTISLPHTWHSYPRPTATLKEAHSNTLAPRFAHVGRQTSRKPAPGDTLPPNSNHCPTLQDLKGDTLVLNPCRWSTLREKLPGRGEGGTHHRAHPASAPNPGAGNQAASASVGHITHQ